jgi:dTMP kinase
MIKELEAGTTLICDRYAFSGIAFSAAKGLPPSSTSSYEEKTTPSDSTTTLPTSPTTTTLSYEWCRAPDTSLPAPDLVLFLDVTPEVQASRGGYGQERYEKADLQRRVREVFRRIAGEFQTSSKGLESSVVQWCKIDAGCSKQDVSYDIWTAVQPLVENGGIDRPIGRLWEDVLH